MTDETIHPQRGRPPKITRDDVIDAATRLGLAHLTVVAVAEELGVRDSTIYRHVASRDELVHLVADRILDDFDADFAPDLDAGRLLVDFGQRVREFLVKHDGFAAYCIEHGERTRIRRIAEHLYDVLAERGFDAAATVVLIDAVSSFVFANAQAAPVGIQAQAVTDEVELSPVHAAGRLVTDQLDPSEYYHWLLTAHVNGLLAAITDPDAPWKR